MTPENPAYNAELARQLGADDHGMKKYVIASLKRGPTRLSGAEAEGLQNAHLKNIGISIFNPEIVGRALPPAFVLKWKEEVRKLTESDPAVQRGTLQFELRPWYGSAALLKISRIHETIEKKASLTNATTA